MLGFLKRDEGSDDPLFSLKNVSHWIGNLPVGDIYSAQKAVLAKLVEFNQADQGYSLERLAVLCGLDEQSRDMQASLCSQYLRNPRMSRETEGRLWAVIHGCHYEVARAYNAFLMHMIANPGGRKFRSQVPLLTARALHATAQVIKWRYFHFERIDEKLWLRMHNLYRMAESKAFDDKKLTLYDAHAPRTSPKDEYLKALFLSNFGNGNLLPKQLEMIDGWLSNWVGLAQFDSQFDPTQHCFFVDISTGRGLRRIRNPGDNPAWRYIGATRLRAKVREVRISLDEGKAPIKLGLGEEFRLPDGHMLLDIVEDEWAPLEQRERRHEPREPKQGRWDIIRDLPNIFIALQLTSDAKPGRVRTHLTEEEIMDMKLYGFITERTRAAQIELRPTSVPEGQRARWLQVDGSDEGIGFAVSGVVLNWARTTHLLAMRPDGSEGPWKLGVVSRLVGNEGAQRIIGVQFIKGHLDLINLEEEALLPDPELAKDGYEVHDSSQGVGYLGHALLLTEPDGTLAIILENTRYGHGRQYLIRLPNGKTQLVQMEAIQTKGEGWLKAAYKVLAQG